MRRDVDDAIRALAASRAGAFCLDEVLEAGGDRWLAQRRVRSGLWSPRSGGTFVLAGAPPTLDQRRHLGLLALGPSAVLSHESGAELHHLDGIRRGLVVLSEPHPQRYSPGPGMIVHRIDDIVDDDVTEIDGFRTTTATRTIIDLASVVSDLRLQRAIESALTDRRATFASIDRVLRRVRRQGKPGVRKLVRVLDRLDGEPPPASELERILERVVARAGVRAVRQFPLPWDREPMLGLVDFAVPDSRLLLEADGRSWHGRLDAMAKDRRRDRQAIRADWEPLRFTYHELIEDPGGCADDIRVVHRRRAAAA